MYNKKHSLGEHRTHLVAFKWTEQRTTQTQRSQYTGSIIWKKQQCAFKKYIVVASKYTAQNLKVFQTTQHNMCFIFSIADCKIQNTQTYQCRAVQYGWSRWYLLFLLGFANQSIFSCGEARGREMLHIILLNTHWQCSWFHSEMQPSGVEQCAAAASAEQSGA